MKKTKQSRKFDFLAIENIFVPIALVFGIWLSFANPPFQSNDEDRHFYNAYAYANGYITSTNGMQWPENLVKIVQSYQGIPFAQGKKISRQQLDYIATIPLNPDVKTDAKLTFFGCSTGYLFHIPGIWLGLLFNSTPLWIQWITRIVGVMFYIAIVYMALRITPVHKGLMFLLSLTPMFLFQASSISYDTPLLAFYFLITALIYRFAFGETQHLKYRDLLLFIFLSILMIGAKDGYFLLLLLMFMVPYQKFGNIKNYILIACFVLFGFFIKGTYDSSATMLLSKIDASKAVETVITPGAESQTGAVSAVKIDSAAKSSLIDDEKFDDATVGLKPTGMQRDFAYGGSVNINVVLKTPFKYLGIFWDNFIMQKKNWVGGTIGRFGYSYTFLPDFVLVLHSLMILLIAFIDVRRDINISFWKRLLALAVGLLSCVMIITGFFVGQSPAGAIMFFGIQGRYFAPMVLIMSLFLYNNFFEIKGWHKWQGVILGVYSTLILAYTVYFFNNTFYEP